MWVFLPILFYMTKKIGAIGFLVLTFRFAVTLFNYILKKKDNTIFLNKSDGFSCMLNDSKIN